MSITVNYSLSPFLITIPKSDLTIESGTKYILDVDDFWQLLRDYADSEEGIVQSIIYTRIPATASTPSITEINDDYYEVEFEDGLYSVNIINGNTNVRDVEVKNQVSVNTNNTTGFIEPVFLEHSTFAGGVTLDETSPYSGTAYPIGTPSAPVNNLTDAITIAHGRGFINFYVRGDCTIATEDVSDGHIFIGESRTLTTITVSDPANVLNAQFQNATFEGILDGGSTIEDCDVLDLSYVNGKILRCGLKGIITLGGSLQTSIINCWSEVAGGAATPEVDMGGSGNSLVIRGYDGGIEISNCTSALGGTSIDMNSGQVIFANTITAGTYTVRGISKIVHTQTGTENVIDETVPGTLAEDTATAVWEKQLNGVVTGSYGEVQKQSAFQAHIHVDQNNGVAGTAYPLGTYTHPTNNIADAVAIGTREGINVINVEEDATFLATDNIDGFVINGIHASKSEFTFAAGVSTVFCEFNDCTMSGTTNGFITVRDGVIDDLLGFQGVLHQTVINGSVTLTGSQTSHVLDCFSGVPGQSTPSIDMGGSGPKLAVRNYNGGVKLENKTGPEAVSFDMNSGQVLIDGSVTDGNIVIRGLAKVTHTQTGTEVVDDETTTPPTIAEAVWNHVKALTFQKFIGNN